MIVIGKVKKMPKNSLIIAVVVVAVLIVAGIITGILLSTKGTNENNQGSQQGQGISNLGESSGQASSNESSGTGQSQQEGQGQVQEMPQTYNINIANFAFSQKEIRIKKGDRIVWTNKDSASHTVTSDSGSELGSGFLSNEESYSHTFNTAGTFSYHCSPHPYMQAKVIVE